MKSLTRIMLVPVLALATGISWVQAAVVDFTLTGVVDTADAGNSFGLSAGDTISVTGLFDDSGLTGVGTETVSFGSGSGNSLQIIVGNMSFTEADDVDYGLGGSPSFTFLDGSFDGFDFLAYFGSAGQFESTVLSAGAMDDNFNVVNSTWVNYSVAAVPVPAAVWLFGSGLLGLVGIARRKR